MPPIGTTATLNLAKFAPNARGWDADVNANWDTIDATFVSSKAAGWITSGVFAAARIPLATALVAGAVFAGAGSNLTLNAGTGELSLTQQNVWDALGYIPKDAADAGQPNGFAPLDANALIPSVHIPPIALTRITVVADDTARFALDPADVQVGDVVKVTGTGKTYVVSAADLTQAGSYVEITDGVGITTVNGKSGGTVLLTTDDVGEGSTNLYFTTARAQAAVTKAVVEGVLTGTITSHNHDTQYLGLGGGTLTGALTLSGAPTLALHAATKGYVDTGLGNKLDLGGGTLTGYLTLVGDPTTNLHAATKGYVDTADATKLDLAGGTLTGALTLAGAPTANLHAATKKYVDDGLALKLALAGGTLTGALILAGDPTTGLQAATKNYVDTTIAGFDFLQKAGGTMTGNIVLVGDPTAALHPATKQYTDTGLNAKLNLAGGTMTGALTLSGAPTLALHAATKAYVDAQIGANAGVTSFNGRNGVVTLSSQDVTDALTFTPENIANRGAANGYAPLGADSKIDSVYLPPIALTSGQVVADQAARLALTAGDVQPGDFVKEADTGKVYLLAAADPSVNANWIEVADTNAVISVNGKTGTTLTLTTDDVAEGATNQYFTAARVQTVGDARYLKLAGGTLTGALTLSGAPTLDLHASTKKYVDDAVAAVAATAGVTSFNSRTGAITLTGLDVNTALGYTAADAAALNASALTSGTVPDARIAANVTRRQQKAALSLMAQGPLSGFTGVAVADYDINLGGAKTWGKLIISSASLGNGDSFTIDLLKVTANGGAGTSIFQVAAKPVLNGTGTAGDGHLDWAVVLPGAMDSAALGDGEGYILKITSVTGNPEDVRVAFYEAP